MIANNIDFGVAKLNIRNFTKKESNILKNTYVMEDSPDTFSTAHSVQRAIILAAGFGMRMVPINNEVPKGLIQIDGEPLIERLIKQLQEKGITDIYIVVGFKKEMYEYLIDKYNVKFIYNMKFSTYNNIYSVYLANKKICNSYIIPCDLWFKENPFSNFEIQSWYLFSSKRIKDSRYFVTKSGLVKHIPTDGNALIGLAYINKKDGEDLSEYFDEVIEKQINLNRFWEIGLIDKKIPIIGKVINDHDYYEFNSYEDVVSVDDNSQQLENEAIAVIERVLSTDKKSISHIKVLKKGMTNRSFLFSCNNQKYIMRIPGEGTEKLINRKHEFDVYNAIRKMPWTEDILYLNPKNGYKLSKYISSAKAVDIHDKMQVQQCIDLLKLVHKSNIKVGHTFNLWDQINFYERLRGLNSNYRDYEQTKHKVEKLKGLVEQNIDKWTLCHIDANLDNFLYGQNKKLYLIDWEYAAMQDPDLDIAMMAIYSLFDKEKIDSLINMYYKEGCSKIRRYKIYAYVAIGGLLWSNWCEYKEQLNLNFGEYSTAQYRYAKTYSQLVLNFLDEAKNGKS